MSSSAQVFFYDIKLYLSTNSYGYLLPLIVRDSLKRRLRWRHPHFLVQILLSDMMKFQSSPGMDFFINTQSIQNDFPLLFISNRKQFVMILEQFWRFEDYIQLSDNSLRNIWRNSMLKYSLKKAQISFE